MNPEQITQKIESGKPGDKTRNRWWLYSSTGLIFGIAYWGYLGMTANFVNYVDGALYTLYNIPEEARQTWFLLPVALLAYFGVWLIPAILVAVYESRHSKTPYLSALAVVMVWTSGVLGYYVIYVALLALFGLPNMEYLLVFGERSPTIWQDWGAIFPTLILSNFLKWTAVGVIGGGFAGFVISLLYPRLIKKNHRPVNVENLEKQLLLWEKGLFIGFGAGLMLLLVALLQTHRMHKSEVFEWYIAWLIFEILVTPPGFLLLLVSPWKRIPLHKRTNTAYGYLATAWLGLFAFGVQTGSDSRNWDDGLGSIMSIATLIILGTGALLVITYYLLRRVGIAEQEEIFP